MDDEQTRDRALRLFRCLSKLTQLRTRAVHLFSNDTNKLAEANI